MLKLGFRGGQEAAWRLCRSREGISMFRSYLLLLYDSKGMGVSTSPVFQGMTDYPIQALVWWPSSGPLHSVPSVACRLGALRRYNTPSESGPGICTV